MLFLSIYPTIAAIAFFVILGYLHGAQPRDVPDHLGIFLVSLACGLLWPAILFGILFDLAEKRP